MSPPHANPDSTPELTWSQLIVGLNPTNQIYDLFTHVKDLDSIKENKENNKQTNLIISNNMPKKNGYN